MNCFTSQTLSDADSAASALAVDFARWAAASSEVLNVALSGGRTPERFFAELAREPFRGLPWRRLRFFWVDERWVPHGSPESNFGNTRRVLFDPVGFPDAGLHPMVENGDDPAASATPAVLRHAAERYSRLLRAKLPASPAGVPVFDLVLLGMGADGHTASLFPGTEPDRPDHPCSAAWHPLTGAPRLTLTLPVINQARRVVFLVTGADKAAALRAVRNPQAGVLRLPAGAVEPVSGPASWYLDAAAAGG